MPRKATLQCPCAVCPAAASAGVVFAFTEHHTSACRAPCRIPAQATQGIRTTLPLSYSSITRWWAVSLAPKVRMITRSLPSCEMPLSRRVRRCFRHCAAEAKREASGITRGICVTFDRTLACLANTTRTCTLENKGHGDGAGRCLDSGMHQRGVAYLHRKARRVWVLRPVVRRGVDADTRLDQQHRLQSACAHNTRGL